MNLALVDVIIATSAVVAAGVAFTLWKFKGTHGRDHDTTELLKHFFDGKSCAICKRPIPPVHRSGMKPGLLDPKTHQTYSWDEIPTVNLSSALQTHLPVCSECEVAEEFRQRFPALVVNGDRTSHDAHEASPAAAAAKAAVVKDSLTAE